MVSHHGSCLKNEHYTPRALFDYIHCVSGEIDLDVASDEIGNRAARAKKYFTKKDNGFTKDWEGKVVFCNPPGRTKDTMHLPGQSEWFLKMINQHRAGNFNEGWFIGYSIELLCKVGYDAFKYCLCVPQPGKLTGNTHFVSGMGRIMFDAYDFQADERVRQRSPMHGNVIIYLPPMNHKFSNVQIPKFENVFKKLGAIHTSTDYQK
ncbi:DNA N-6-adenine-methyltransferase [Nostoc phage YongM]|nr:DNA N-6-adenine-methyltransferase [Nostoc phage YongM]